jgi:hypothetical protein
MPTFTLTVWGIDFTNNSIIVFNNVEKATIFVSAIQLTCEINPGDIPTGPVTLPVKVRLTPGGDDSNIIYFTVFENHSFEAPQNISNNGGNSDQPAIAVHNNGDINVIWRDNTSGNYEIYYRRSTNDGYSWDSTVNVTNNPGISYVPDIAMNNTGILNVVWFDNTWGFEEIYFSRSLNNGSTWTFPVNISKSPEYAYEPYNPAIAVNGIGFISVVWSSIPLTSAVTRVFFSHSTSQGSSWTWPKNVSQPFGENENCMHADVEVDDLGNIYIVYHHDGKNIMFQRSNNNGNAWSSPLNIAGTPSLSYRPDMAVDDSGTIHVVWYDYSPGNYDIYYTFSTNNGTNWSPVQNISNSSTHSLRPAIVTDSAGNLNVVWEEHTAAYREIFFRRSIDKGITWGTTLSIHSNTGSTADPSDSDIGVDGLGNISVVWENYTTGAEIYFTNSLQWN